MASDADPARRTGFRKLLDQPFEIGVAGAELSSEPVPTTSGKSLAVYDHVKLPRRSRSGQDLGTDLLLDEGHETRDPGFVVRSRGAVGNLDPHRSLRCVESLAFLGRRL